MAPRTRQAKVLAQNTSPRHILRRPAATIPIALSYGWLCQKAATPKRQQAKALRPISDPRLGQRCGCKAFMQAHVSMKPCCISTDYDQQCSSRACQQEGLFSSLTKTRLVFSYLIYRAMSAVRALHPKVMEFYL